MLLIYLTIIIIFLFALIVNNVKSDHFINYQGVEYSNKLALKDIKNIKKGQKIMTNMLKEFDRICRKYNLKYWCIGGTLIGVLRHRGWVPWDGDLDIAMLDTDYEIFEKVTTKELPSNLWLQSRETDRWYRRPKGNNNPLPKAKLRDLTSCYLECQDGENWHNGLQLDIFIYKKKGKILESIIGKINDLDDIEYNAIFPLKEKFFDKVKVYIPNKFEEYSIKKWGNYPPKMIPMDKRYPHEGRICFTIPKWMTNKYPNLY